MAKKSKSSPLKPILMVLVLILLIGGGLIAAVYFQILNIPGLEFIRKLSQPPKQTKTLIPVEPTPSPAPISPTPNKKKEEMKKQTTEKPKPTTDLKKGAKQTAKLWNQIETKKLVDIVKNWPNQDLARVIMQMETSQASALLEALEPSKSAELSKIIQQESSQISSEASSL